MSRFYVIIMNIEIRDGSSSDSEWLYALYCSTMKIHIEKMWGWDEEFQRNGFFKNLPSEQFHIVVKNGEDTGAYQIVDKEDHLQLKMIIIKPEAQSQGIGKWIMNKLQNESKESNKPLKLNIIKGNPAKSFYLDLGFFVYEEDKELIKMEWTCN